jgi:ABC-type transport system substrate-binding protein
MGRVVAVVGVLALVAAACIGSDSDPAADTTSTAPTTTAAINPTSTSTTAAPESKPYGGTLEYFVDVQAVGQSLNPYLFLDPFNPVANPTVEGVGPAALGGVWRVDGDSGELEPDLVTVLPSVENGGLVINEDGTVTVRYEIDPEAVWSDGVPISGDDFAFTYEVVTETIARLEAAAADDATDEEYFETCGHQQLIRVPGAEAFVAIDPDTIVAEETSFEFTLTDPAAYSTALFPYLVPRHAVEGTDFLNDWHVRMWPSAGPFVVESHDAVGHEVTLVRNENYWRTDPATGQQLPYLDRLVLTALVDEVVERMPADVGELYRGFIDCNSGDGAFARLGIEPGSNEAFELFGRTAALTDEIVTELFVDGLVIDLENAEHLALLEERVPGLEAQGVEFGIVQSAFWEHMTFHYGDARFRANEDSLVEHVEFRRAIAHALDRRRIAEEATGLPVDPIGSFVEAYSPSLSGEGWDRYDYDPETARQLLDDLCTKLDRDCVADPPLLVFTHLPFRFNRGVVAGLVVEMLGEVGIEVELVEQDSVEMVFFAGCSGWESSIWAYSGSGFTGFDFLPEMFVVFDPSASANPDAQGGRGIAPRGANVYAWGTDAVTDGEDLPDTADCDESTVFNQGPSSVRDVTTQRVDDLLRLTEAVVDPADYRLPVLEMEDILADQAVIIPLYVVPRRLAWRADIVGGYGRLSDGGDNPAMWNVGEWYLIDG